MGLSLNVEDPFPGESQIKIAEEWCTTICYIKTTGDQALSTMLKISGDDSESLSGFLMKLLHEFKISIHTLFKNAMPVMYLGWVLVKK